MSAAARIARRAAGSAMVAAGLAFCVTHAALAQARLSMTPSPAMTRAPPGIRTATPPLGGPAAALGSIQLSLGALGPSPTGTLGTIAPCPTTGIAISPTSAAATAPTAAATGVLPPTTLGSSFGTLSMSGVCNAIVPGALPQATAPPDASAAAFANGALPLITTESGSGGLSPLVTVPAPSIPANPGAVPLNTGETPSAFITAGPGTSLIPVLPIPAISSSGCAGGPSCGGTP